MEFAFLGGGKNGQVRVNIIKATIKIFDNRWNRFKVRVHRWGIIGLLHGSHIIINIKVGLANPIVG